MEIKQWIEQAIDVVGSILSVVPSFVWVFALFAAFCLYKAISESTYECGLLSNHFDDVMKMNSKFGKEFYETIHRMAAREFGSTGSDAFFAYEDRLYDEVDSLIFRHNSNAPDIFTFHPDFCSWVAMTVPQAKVYDFSKLVTRYRQSLELQLAQQQRDNMDAERRCMEITAVMEKVKSERAAKLYEARKDHTSKRDVVTIYNGYIRMIKEENGRGLMPVKTNELPQSVYRYLYVTVVLSNQILHKIFDVDYSEIDVPGCAIVFNTYTERYLIIKSHKIYTALKDLLTGQTIEYAATFGADLLLGHLPLVRVVPLDKSGYTNINLLYKSLIRAYDACEPHGYNARKSLDI